MADLTPQEANQQGLGWVDRNNPNYGKPGFVGSTPTSGGTATPSPSSTPGVPGAVDPGLKNPSPASSPTMQPSPAPQIGLGNTVDARYPQPTTGTGLQRTQADGLQAAGQQPAPQQTPAQQMQGQLRQSIMGLLNQNVNQASVTDADIAPQSQAFAAAQERYGAARRAELAQQASRGGWADSGGFDQRLDKISQDTAQAVGANDAALIGQKLDSRKQQLQFAIDQAKQLGMSDEANNLQRQLANLNAQVQTRGQDVDVRGQDVQTKLANMDSSVRIYLGDLNAQLQREGYSTQERLAQLDAAAKRYGIDVQGRLGDLDAAIRNRQVDLGYDQLGLDAATTQARLNREALVGAMGG